MGDTVTVAQVRGDISQLHRGSPSKLLERHRLEGRFPVGVVTASPAFAFLEVGGWQQSELKSAAADVTFSLLWAALPLVSEQLFFLLHSSLLSVPALQTGPAPRRWLVGPFGRRYRKPKPLALQGCLCSGKSSSALDKRPKGSQAGVMSGGSQEHGGDPPKKRRQKYLVLANCLVANETSLAQIRGGSGWGCFFVCSPF